MHFSNVRLSPLASYLDRPSYMILYGPLQPPSKELFTSRKTYGGFSFDFSKVSYGDDSEHTSFPVEKFVTSFEIVSVGYFVAYYAVLEISRCYFDSLCTDA